MSSSISCTVRLAINSWVPVKIFSFIFGSAFQKAQAKWRLFGFVNPLLENPGCPLSFIYFFVTLVTNVSMIYLHGHDIRVSPWWLTEDHGCCIIYRCIVRKVYLGKYDNKTKILETYTLEIHYKYTSNLGFIKSLSFSLV